MSLASSFRTSASGFLHHCWFLKLDLLTCTHTHLCTHTRAPPLQVHSEAGKEACGSAVEESGTYFSVSLAHPITMEDIACLPQSKTPAWFTSQNEQTICHMSWVLRKPPQESK
jgi:hypothetical protein